MPRAPAPIAPVHPQPPPDGHAADGEWHALEPTTRPSTELPATQPAADGGVITYAGVAVRWPGREKLLELCREGDHIVSAALLFAGVAYACFGYTLFRMLTVANVAALGVWGGWLAGKRLDAALAGALVGGVLAAAVAWPALRYAVALCGAIIGFVVGVAAWRALGLADAYTPAGGVIGATFLSMLSFINFKLTIIAFTAIQGTVMLLAGALGLLLKHERIDAPLTAWATGHRIAVPLSLFVLSTLGLLFQQSWHRGTPGK